VVRGDQGDQIGRIFAYWTIVFFDQFIENYTSSANSWAAFFHSTSYVLILSKNWLGCILGDFFTNSSGHTGGDEHDSEYWPTERKWFWTFP
jgi:hypothetical protein